MPLTSKPREALKRTARIQGMAVLRGYQFRVWARGSKPVENHQRRPSACARRSLWSDFADTEFGNEFAVLDDVLCPQIGLKASAFTDEAQQPGPAVVVLL